MPSQYASQTVTDMEECFKLAKVRSMAHCGHMKFISLSRTKSDSARSKVTRQNQGHFRRIVNESQYIEVTKPRNKSSPHNQKKKKITQRKSTKETIGQRNLWQEKKTDKTLKYANVQNRLIVCRWQEPCPPLCSAWPPLNATNVPIQCLYQNHAKTNGPLAFVNKKRNRARTNMLKTQHGMDKSRCKYQHLRCTRHDTDWHFA